MAEINLTNDNFENEVLNSDIPVLVDFWANWCGPCKMLAPIISEIAEEYEGKIKVCKVNIDEAGELAVNYKIVSIPTILVFKNGEVSDKAIGYRPKEDIVKLLG